VIPNLAYRAVPELVLGAVMHRRPAGPIQPFAYPVAYLRLPLSQLAGAEAAGLAINRWGIWSFHTRDHGPRDGSDLQQWARNQLAAHGINGADGEITLQCFPRTMGWAFNPVSFWFCQNRHGELVAVLAEVSNTFGEQHNYLLSHPDGRPFAAGDEFVVRKVFHVSPFFDRIGHYRFIFAGAPGATAVGKTARVAIDYIGPEGTRLETAIAGQAQPLTPASLRSARRRFPWQTLTTMARIHLQAGRLWRKRVPFHPKPNPPSMETTS
jgi:DUF1365 family protein